MSQEHAFTAVDDQAAPERWIAVLDRLGNEPFYRAYKARVRQLLRARPGGRYLDVGCGTGADGLALAAETACEVAGVDRSRAMVAEARRRGLAAELGEATALPFADRSFDGCWCDRTLQHVDGPGAAVAELARVLRPGGRLVVADPDYETHVVAIEDSALARRVLAYRRDRVIRNGTLAHRLAPLLHEAGLVGVSAEARTLVVRDPTSVDHVLGLRSWAAHAAERGALAAGDVARWEAALDATIADGSFLYALTFFLWRAEKPPAS